MENLRQVPAAGGTPTALTTVNTTARESFHHYPMLVPATGDILFVMYDDEGNRQLEVYRWDTRERVKLLPNVKGPAFAASGHILFTQDDTLMAATYDAQRRTAGPAVPLPESVIVDSVMFGTPQLVVGPTGTMAYVPTNPQQPSITAGWVDRAGVYQEIGPLPKGTSDFSVSPDGKTVAILAGTRLSLFDPVRGVTTAVASPQRAIESVNWHPDSRRLTLGGAYLSLFDLDSGQDTRLTESGRPKRLATWSPDGRTVVYMTFNPGNDIHMLALDQGAKPRPFVATDGIEADPVISPDGRLMAYTAAPASGETSGRREIYVVRYPEGTGKVQITSSGGGPRPFWSRDSRELYFSAPPGVLKVASITAGDRIQIGEARTLFPLNDLNFGGLSPDGARFIAVRVPRVEPPTEIVVVQNWLQDLARVVPKN
jgi:dipeptidyl aminopeptidase/acylaminoacyl peptidase